MARNADPLDSVAQLSALLEQLNLTTAARCLPTVLAQAERQPPTYSDFLRQLLEIGQCSRWERELQRRRRWSKLGPPVSRDGFDWAARPQLVKELLTCRLIEEHRNVLLVGRPSTGKTTIAKALGHAACSHALSVHYAPTAEVLETLPVAREALAPLADDLARQIEPAGDDIIGHTLGGEQHQLGPDHVSIRRRIPTRARFEFRALGRGQLDSVRAQLGHSRWYLRRPASQVYS
jgi:hypothetical protein